jgi:thiol-disulfide isomerase/thioredoxin
VKLLLLLQAAIPGAADSLAGTWQAALDLAGGALPFEVIISRSPAGWRGELSNLPQRWRSFSAVRVTGDTVVLEMGDYDASITAALQGDSLKGYYHNVGSNGPRTIPFRAAKGTRRRVRAPRALLGRWDATYFQEAGTSPRVFEFRNGDRGFEGIIISSTTDYGPFMGNVVADSFAIGLFDGSFVYLLTGRLTGDTLRGTFHAGLRIQTQWEAVRSTGKPRLRSPTDITQADTIKPLRFAFPDLHGRMVRHDDPRFKGKVVLLDVFGTWCPTCHDATPELLRLYRRYHSRGLEVVGLAFEATGDTAVDARQVRRYRDKFRIPFPLLLAGTSDTESMADALPQLQDLTAFPTTIFVGRDGRVRRVHAGFHGLAAGPQHRQMVRDFEREIEKLLKENRKE